MDGSRDRVRVHRVGNDRSSPERKLDLDTFARQGMDDPAQVIEVADQPIVLTRI
jgi:hypothetical protein